MCVWCKVNAGITPKVSDVKVPMVCKECGMRVCTYGWEELKNVFEQYEKKISILESTLERIKVND